MKALLQRYRAEILLVVLTVGGSLLVYLPFWNGMGTVYRAWDGPNYLTIAKTGYEIPKNFALLGYVYVDSYYLRHFPVYPALIRLFSFVGWQRSMLLVSILCAAGAALLFYRLCRDHWKLPQPLFLASVFLFFPPRWLYFRSTGSTEAPYLLFVLAAIYLFEKDRVGWASVMAALATLTRSSSGYFATARITATQKTRNCMFSCGVSPGFSRFSPRSVAMLQLLCLPLPLMPAKGFSCSRHTRPYFSAVAWMSSMSMREASS